MRRNKLFLALFLVLLLPLFVFSKSSSDIDIPKELPDEPFDIRADHLSYTNGTLIAIGSVTGRFERAVLRADEVRGNPDTGDLHAKGNVQFERDDLFWQGSELDYNFITQKGNFGESEFNFGPVIMQVEQIERVSTNEFFLKNATFTTCSKEHPHYHIATKEAHLVAEDYLSAKGATFYIGKYPVLYLPYWNHRLQESMFTFKLGYGSDWGGYALTTTTLPITKDIDSLTDINLYSSRGVGIGQGFAWNKPSAVGEFASFYLRDREPNARFDSPEITEDRYRFKFEHLQNFSDTHYINTKWNYLSDPAILEEFFRSEYHENVQPENYASWVFGNHFVGTEGFVSTRLNDFYDNINRYEYSADLYRTRLGKTPFYFETQNAVSQLERVYSETNSPYPSSYDAVRIDSKNTLYMPQRLAFLSLVPRVGYRATYYSQTANDGGGKYRQIPSAGMEISFQASKIISERTRWYGQGLRHKLEPYLDYSYQNSSVATNRLLQFDGVDQQRDGNTLKVGLRNVLQTRRDGRLSRFLDLDLYTYWLVEKNGAEHDFDDLYIDARVPLAKRVMLDAEGRFDWYEGSFPYFDTRLSYDRERVIFGIEYLYESGKRSLWTPTIDLFPEEKFSLEAYVRYDDKTASFQEYSAIIYFNHCCMRYGLGYHCYDDGETRVMFSIGLSAFPDAKISSSL